MWPAGSQVGFAQLRLVSVCTTLVNAAAATPNT